MSFLRRLFGGSGADRPAEAPPPDDAEIEADEKAYELDLLREEQSRLDDLRQRQLRYESYAWQPPDQGGAIRSEDAGESDDASS